MNMPCFVSHVFRRLLAVTDEMTLTEFLAKATRIVVDWIQLPNMKVREFSIDDGFASF
jgi:hypothetical protein